MASFSMTTTSLLYLEKRSSVKLPEVVGILPQSACKCFVNLSFCLEQAKKTRSGKITFATRSKSLRSLISSPAPLSFKHVAHVGVNRDGVFEASKGLEGSWTDMLRDLQGHGVSEVALRQSNFGDGFWKGVEAIRTGDDSDADKFEGKLTDYDVLPVPLILS